MSIDEYLTRQLKEGETVTATIRRHPVVLVPSVAVGAGLVLLDFFLVAWWFQQRSWGAIGFVIILLFGALMIARGIFVWSRNILVITNERIIDINQRGFFSRTVAEATYEKIQDVQSTIVGVWATIFQFGAIAVKTAGSGTSLDIRGIRHPQEVQRIITDAQQRHHPAGPSDLSAKELLGIVDQLRQRLGPEELQRILKKGPPNS